MMALKLSNTQLQDLLQRWRTGIQPWTEFINTKRFQLPIAVQPAGRRVLKNIDKFQCNYAVIFLVFVTAAILLTPMLLLAISLCLAACYAIMHRGQEKRLSVFGRDLTMTHQYAIVGVMSVPLLWLIGAGSIVSWVIGISSMTAFLHAVLYNSDDDYRSTDLLVLEHV